jgi:hypothetical protein
VTRSKTFPPRPSSQHTSITLVGALGASDAADEELTWFFEEALSAIEPPSNYERMLMKLALRASTREANELDEAAEARVEALHAARTIYERLMTLAPDDRSVIRALYTPVDLPAWLEDACGWLTPLVCVLPLVLRELEEARACGRTQALTAADWLAGIVLAEGAEAVQPLVEEARGAAARALIAYESTRAGFPRSVVP